MHRKAQAAMEFLMTYGWAILVVLSAIAALSYFGVLNPGRFLPERCQINGGISCVEYAIVKGQTGVAHGGITLRLQNSLSEDISVEYVEIKFKGSPVVGVPGCLGYRPIGGIPFGTPTTIKQGESAFFGTAAVNNALGVSGTSIFGNPSNPACALSPGTPGTHILQGRVKADITVTYRSSSGQISHTVNGEIQGSV